MEPLKHPGGRPTKYDPSFVDEVDKYIERTQNAEKDFPTVEGFAEYLGVDDTTICNWADKRYKKNDEKVDPKLRGKLVRPEFFAAIKRLKNVQKRKLMTDGLYGGKDVNATMAIFLLKVNHGMIETTHNDITTKGKELPVPLLGGASNVSKNDGSN